MWLIKLISLWAIPSILFFVPALGFLRGVKVYEAFVNGAGEGFTTAVKIIPFLVGMLSLIHI